MARGNLRIAVGSYTGNGTANTNIDIGFKPKYVIIKRTAGAANALYLHPDMPYGTNGQVLSSAEITGHCKNISDNGFVLDASAITNPAGTLVNYVAFGGKSEAISVGSYVGNATDNRNYTTVSTYTNTALNNNGDINFTPNFVFVKAATALGNGLKTLGQHGSGDFAGSWDGINEGSDRIQSFSLGGFQLGTANTLNQNATTFRYLAMKTTNEFYAETTYTGNGTSNSCTLPFMPDFLLIKTTTANSAGAIWFKGTPQGTSYGLNSSSDLTTAILSVLQNPVNSSQCIVSVGSDIRVNENAQLIRVYAFKAGDFIVPFNRTLIT